MRDPIQYDAVTGLPDRGHLWSLLDDSLKSVLRNKVNSGVLLIQVHNFSELKISLGEDGIDELLKIIGSRIKNSL